MFKDVLSKLGNLSPFPYYINHLLIAVVLSLIFGTPLAGMFFYVGREIRDWEKEGYFDHKGFWTPVVPTFVWWILTLI